MENEKKLQLPEKKGAMVTKTYRIDPEDAKKVEAARKRIYKDKPLGEIIRALLKTHFGL